MLWSGLRPDWIIALALDSLFGRIITGVKLIQLDCEMLWHKGSKALLRRSHLN